MTAGRGTPADPITVDISGQYDDATREVYGDTMSDQRRSARDPEKMMNKAPSEQNSGQYFGLGLLQDRSRARIDQGLKRVVKWQKRVEKSGEHYYRKWIVEGLLRQKPLSPSKDGRHVPLSAGAVRAQPLVDERSGRPYAPNSIRSNRYTLFSFLPKQLVYQFGRLANFYFLVIGILHLIPGWSPTAKFTTLYAIPGVFHFISPSCLYQERRLPLCMKYRARDTRTTQTMSTILSTRQLLTPVFVVDPSSHLLPSPWPKKGGMITVDTY